jgi:hypothetical protein
MTDIYFWNGVWNDRDDAIVNRDKLKQFMLFKANIKLDPSRNKLDYTFKLAYNPSIEKTDDLMETFYQLRESGQISNGYFQWMFNLLNNDEHISPQEKILEIISTYEGDASDMYQMYQNASFSKYHNVLLVAHSQGNLFGNKMYMLMSDAQKQKFRMVSIATPADSIAADMPALQGCSHDSYLIDYHSPHTVFMC